MATYQAPKGNMKAGYEEQVEVKIHKIRITLTSRHVKNLEKGTFSIAAEKICISSCILVVCADLINRSKEKELKTKGPVRLPTKKLRISTRKSPCGNGSESTIYIFLVSCVDMALNAMPLQPGTPLRCVSTSVPSIWTLLPRLSSKL